MSDKEPIFSTRFYNVYANPELTGYHLFNKVTGVTEGGSVSLTSAISQAQVQNELLTDIVEERQKQ